MKKLYRIKTQFLGKDLNEEAILGYVVADTEAEVADHINKKHKCSEWFGAEGYDDIEDIQAQRTDYMANRGDFHTEYDGEFYDQKYGWEEVGEIADAEITILKLLGITEELAH